MNKYCYSFNKEDYHEGYDTIKETLEEAKRETKVDSKFYEIEEEPQVWIAETVYLQPLIDLDNVLEQLQDQAYDMGSDYVEEYLDDVSNEDLKELEEKLNAIFLEWQNKHNYQPHFFSWKNEKLYDLANGQLLEVHKESHVATPEPYVGDNQSEGMSPFHGPKLTALRLRQTPAPTCEVCGEPIGLIHCNILGQEKNKYRIGHVFYDDKCCYETKMHDTVQDAIDAWNAGEREYTL